MMTDGHFENIMFLNKLNKNDYIGSYCVALILYKDTIKTKSIFFKLFEWVVFELILNNKSNRGAS